MGELMMRDRLVLRWLSKQRDLVWGGVYDRGVVSDPDILRLKNFGYIEAVRQELSVGKATFSGGFRITQAGRAALSQGEKP